MESPNEQKNFFKDNKRFLTKILFVGISAFIWFLLKLSQPGFSATKTFYLYPEVNPKDWFIVDNEPIAFSANLSGSGFELFRFYFFTSDEISVRLPKPEQKNEKGVYTITLEENLVRNALEGGLSSNLMITSLGYDTHTIRLSKMVRKTFPVKDNFNLSFKPPFQQFQDIVFTPDSVQLLFPLLFKDSLKELQTERLVLQQVDREMYGEVNLSLSKDFPVFPEVEKVNYRVKVEAFTEGTDSVQILVYGMEENAQIKLYPPYVTVKFNAPLSVHKDLKPNQFRVEADIRSQIDPEENKLYLNLSQVPEGVRVISWSPQKVDFILTKSSND